MSIVRIGLAETRNFAEGWEAIFGKKSTTEAKKAEGTAKKPAAKKATKKDAGKKKKATKKK